MPLRVHGSSALPFVEVRITDPRRGVSRVPDVSVFIWDRIERDPQARQQSASIPPDIAIEIASPGQSRQKQIERCQEFIEQGARIALMFDPRTKSVVDVRPGGVERRSAWRRRARPRRGHPGADARRRRPVRAARLSSDRVDRKVGDGRRRRAPAGAQPAGRATDASARPS